MFVVTVPGPQAVDQRPTFRADSFFSQSLPSDLPDDLSDYRTSNLDDNESLGLKTAYGSSSLDSPTRRGNRFQQQPP